jgi:RNA polymerase sigma-B factor
VAVGESVIDRTGRTQSRAERLRAERDLLVRYRRDGDRRAREELIERFLPLAHHLARRYRRGQEPLDDLIQVASLALVKAVDGFDPARGTAFSSYAVPTIVGELKRHFRDAGWAVHVPRSLQERALEVEEVVARLSGELGRSPSPAEVARDLGSPAEDVLEALDVASAYEAVSLDSPLDRDSDGAFNRFDAIGTRDEGFELAELGATIAPALRALPERERRILHLRFAEDLTQSQIAERVGVSQMHVSRLIRRSLTRVREAADADAA